MIVHGLDVLSQKGKESVSTGTSTRVKMEEELTTRNNVTAEQASTNLSSLIESSALSAGQESGGDQGLLAFPACAPRTFWEILTNTTSTVEKRFSASGWQHFLLFLILFQLFSLGYFKLPLAFYWFAIPALYSYFFPAQPQITMTNKGVQKSFYSGIYRRLYFRPWSKILSIRFVKSENVPSVGMSGLFFLDRSDAIVLEWITHGPWDFFKNFQSTDYINISKFDWRQREQFFQLLSRHVPQEILSPEVLYLQLQTLSGSEDSTTGEYTKMWLDEYSRRFEISNYLALSPGVRCGNGRYTITMLIRTKTNASTYLAIDAKNRKVAIKELVAPVDCTDAAQTKILEQFNREASLLSKLNHKNIVDIQDHFIEGGRTYIVMDCVPGKNMRELVRVRGCLSMNEVLIIAKQLASVLSYLHHQEPPILHRDLTPDNMVYVEEDKSVVVLDFGAANVFTAGRTATLVGKQFYMPPEQLRGKTQPASDVYTFGATLSFLLSGKDLPSMGRLPKFDQAQVNPALIDLITECTSFDAIARPDAENIMKRLELISDSTQTKVV